MTTAERAQWRQGWTPPRLATPDVDNMAGAVMDALNDTGLCWVDDAQAEIASVTSTWAAKGEPAHIVVTLERVAWGVPTTQKM
jgi:Holliday junction resolvase RusA-like endonuclease